LQDRNPHEVEYLEGTGRERKAHTSFIPAYQVKQNKCVCNIAKLEIVNQETNFKNKMLPFPIYNLWYFSVPLLGMNHHH
jgi:hypothetical protein